jgi:hypothetical protein
MSSRSHPALFETTHSALLLTRGSGAGAPASDRTVDDGHKFNLDKSFWMMRELGRSLGGVPICVP